MEKETVMSSGPGLGVEVPREHLLWPWSCECLVYNSFIHSFCFEVHMSKVIKLTTIKW